MPRTVAALYDSRAEADWARARLASEAKVKTARIIAKDTVGALEGLNFSPWDVQVYREGLSRGGHLLVAEVLNGATKRIVEILEQSASDDVEERDEREWGDGDQGVQVRLPEEAADSEAPEAERHETGESGRAPPPDAVRRSEPPEEADVPVVEEARIPVAEEELRIGKREVARGGARVRSFTREAPAEEEVSLREEVVDVENRSCERQLSDEEVEAAGLFKERVFEVAQMREEPVVTKVAVVREEVIVRKTVKERVETIRDTVRHTEVEVEDLPGSKGGAPRIFSPGRR